MEHDITKFAIKRILMKAVMYKPETFEWSLQGMGMLRLYFGPELRLHIWDSRYRVPNVSLIHDHPWGFESYVVAGIIRNQRYKVTTGGCTSHSMQTIQCGVGGCLKGGPKDVFLTPAPEVESIYAGDTYHQDRAELHASFPEDGTVTLIRRVFDGATDLDTAHVCWPVGEEWVSAEPRPAAPEEVVDIIQYSLNRWFV